ncbi:hypothetical protein B0T21DRAFT_306481 [Apiosordaria backusii]|uniref:Secreted protein n=1 Tax=Apiosordaria backusii TaxID=314023 RepID=A0AA40EMJ5_9PEZI|nr:hypothetical protein B0T21DRAFT_306481 [Apiosordaria backusii]
MKYLTASALLLQATALAGPIVEARQRQDFAVFTRVSSFRGQGCEGATVSFDEINQVATVTYPNYGVVLPQPREESCSTTLQVRFPTNECTSGTAIGTTSGTVNVAAGVSAFFTARDYAIQPTIGPINDVSPNGRWDGPFSNEYALTDNIGYTFEPTTPENSLVNFTVFGDLSLQPATGPVGSLTSRQYVFDIRTQIPC